MNRYFMPFLTAVGLACFSGQSTYAQDMAAASRQAQSAPNAKKKLLKNVLSELEVKYGVSFLYKSQLEKKPLTTTVMDSHGSLESALESLTNANDLKYKKVRDSFYIIYSKDETPPEQAGDGNNANFEPLNLGGTVYSPRVQEIVVKGKVTDDKGLPIPGATVLLKGTGTGAATDPNGNYTLQVPDGNGILEFSYLGYVKQEEPIANRTTINVQLTPDTKGLNEVVVVGYGTQKKVNLTGAISALSGTDVNWKPVGQVSSALQGVASGVTVQQTSGQPGKDASSIRIRGVGTLNNNDPLVLVDGVQYDINDVDANDIASMSILKDAAAASIYGVRAANGVILITTKRGSTGKPRVTYSNYFGWQNPARLSKFVGAQEFMKLVNLMRENSGSSAQYSDAQIAAYDDPNRNKDQYPDNYWLKDILTGSGFQQSHSIGVGGGTENIKYQFSTNYFDQKGLIKNMDYNRITVRLNTDIKVTDKLNFSADISTRIGDQQEPQGTGGSVWYQFGQAFITNPLNVNKYSDGTWALVRGDQNAIRLQDEGGLNTYKNNLFTGNFKGTYEIVKGLTATGMAAINYRSVYNSMHNKALTYFTDFPANVNTVTKGQNEVTKEYQGYWFRNYQALLEYQKDLGHHSFKLMGGASRLSETNDELSGYRNTLPNGNIEQIDAGAAAGQQAKGTADAYNLVSFFGRLNYSFRDKYLFEANIRRDGSSRFAENQKWGWFPSFSAGWRITGEDFMKSVTFIDNLKLRGSWGELGNDRFESVSGNINIPINYPYQSTYTYNSYAFGGVLYPASGITVYPNSGLTWETTRMTDIGLDATILKNLDITFDYYQKTTYDILLNLRIPYTVGLDAPVQNAGKVRNTGWEFAANYHGKIGKEFNFNVGANLSDVRNKILDMKGGDLVSADNNGIYSARVKGQPIGAFYGYQTEGIYQSQDQVNNHAPQPGSTTGPGDLIYKDQNNDKAVKPGDASVGGDMVYIGSNIPRYTYGVTLGANYKGFDLSTFFQGVAKVDIHTVVMERAPINSDANFKAIHEDSWTPTNTGAAFPRLVSTSQNYASSDFWVKSGAYLRLKSVQLGYTLPKAWVEHIGLSRCRLYVSGQNLLTFSGLPSDIDPEAPNDSRYYPQVRTYTFGLNVAF
ncbi:SusC/RagA family TonB-linked outer membrane protein [Chitinophaga agrisoli]|uniref:SusC/RagA family TonB-linked outer membrane protein n=1 Tax=Chitinophaga agrisoli TaxID=2607653 RepID=A0A5B2VSZ9_9BACT|nr:SusC/RagA family TonB-linked outer membrane protein [Chitinophaga agrisoli]KAA2241780.1 SusC/RagA family TonB-linked outer membrane protein [Chitinophaga agrisoli]